MLRAIKSSTLLAVLLIASHVFASGVSTPDWMRQAAAQSLPSYPPDTDAVVLLKDVTFTVTAPGEYTEHYRRVVKILRPSGRSNGDLIVHLNGKDKVNFIHAWSSDSSGHEFEVKDKEFIETSLFLESLYDDDRFRTARTPAGGPGTVVAFEYEVKHHEFLNALEFMLQEGDPVREVSITLNLPASYEYKEFWSGIDAMKAVTAGPNSWHWTKSDLARIEDEDYRPTAAAIAARLNITYFSADSPKIGDGWEAMGNWYNGLTADRRVASPEIKDKVAQLTSGKSSFDSKVRAITSFMQAEIRYVAIEIGVGGFQPHPAADVFHYRYGDCKDKATLMSTMLREAGIASDYVVINTDRGVAKKEVPSNSFNHVVVAVEIPSGVDTSKYLSIFQSRAGQKMLLFDPTDSYTPLGAIGTHIQDRYALLVLPDGGEVIHTPILDPDSSRTVRQGKFTLTPEGAIAGTIVETRTGDTAASWRASFSSSNEQKRTETLERAVTHTLATAKLQHIQLEALDEKDKDFITRFDMSSDRYAQLSGPLMLLRPRVLGKVSFGLEKKQRKYPIELNGMSRHEDEYEIEIPSGYAIDDMPEPTRIESSFGSYESHIDKGDRKIVYKRTFISRVLEVPTDKMAEFRAFNNRIAEDENAVVVLKKAN